MLFCMYNVKKITLPICLMLQLSPHCKPYLFFHGFAVDDISEYSFCIDFSIKCNIDVDYDENKHLFKSTCRN